MVDKLVNLENIVKKTKPGKAIAIMVHAGSLEELERTKALSIAMPLVKKGVDITLYVYYDGNQIPNLTTSESTADLRAKGLNIKEIHNKKNAVTYTEITDFLRRVYGNINNDGDEKGNEEFKPIHHAYIIQGKNTGRNYLSRTAIYTHRNILISNNREIIPVEIAVFNHQAKFSEWFTNFKKIAGVLIGLPQSMFQAKRDYIELFFETEFAAKLRGYSYRFFHYLKRFDR